MPDKLFKVNTIKFQASTPRRNLFAGLPEIYSSGFDWIVHDTSYLFGD